MSFFKESIERITSPIDRRLISRLSALQTLYKRSRIVTSSRNTELYEANSTATGNKVCLMCLKWELPVDSKQSAQFVRRLARALHYAKHTPQFIAYGIDSAGTAFAVTHHFEFKDIIGVRYELMESAAMFYEIVKQVAALHRQKVVLGDICDKSFSFDANGRIVLVNLFGCVGDSGTQSDEHGYLPPEQRRGEPPSSASDVYALGVLFYQMITRHGFIQAQHRQGHDEYLGQNLQDLLSAYGAAPDWTHDLLRQCLQWDPQRRFADAPQLQRKLAGYLPASQRYFYRRKEAASNESLTVRQRVQLAKDWMARLDYVYYANRVMVAALLIAGIASFSAAKNRYQYTEQTTPALAVAAADLQAKASKQPDSGISRWNEIKQHIRGGKSPGAGGGEEAQKRTAAWGSFAEMSRAGQNSGGEFHRPVPTAGKEDTDEILYFGGMFSKRSDPPDARPSAASRPTVQEHPPDARPSAASRPMLQKQPGKAGVWAAAVPAATVRHAVPGTEHQLYTPQKRLFLELLNAAGQAGHDVQHALAKAVEGTLSYGDIQVIADWSSAYSEYALLAVCANAQQLETLRAAAERLMARPLRNPEMRGYISRMKSRGWTDRLPALQAACVITLASRTSQPSSRDALFVLMNDFGAMLLSPLPEAVPDIAPWCAVPKSGRRPIIPAATARPVTGLKAAIAARQGSR